MPEHLCLTVLWARFELALYSVSKFSEPGRVSYTTIE